MADDPYGGSAASIATSVSIPQSASVDLSATISTHVSAFCNGGPTPGIVCAPASANSTADINLQLATTGPVRQGYIEITRPIDNWVGSMDGFGANWSVSIGSVNGSCFGGMDDMTGCSNIADHYFYLPHFNSELPFTLGVPFTFDDSLTANAGATDGGASGDVSEAIGFRLTEEDGTPVAIDVVPEPASFGLIALPVLLMIWFRRRVPGPVIRHS